ncbi:MAG: enoyl-CoA hydratase-related protein [Planctomycetota bacterium]|nr:enoyl-CoA hydratase-related protein [Planctomycetota bacterium]
MTEASDYIQVEHDGPVAHVRLNRPEKRNAFDDHTAQVLERAFAALEHIPDLRAVVLSGNGKVFCAGGDMTWMRRVADYSHEENLADAEAFQQAFDRIDRFPAPVIARVHGAALGGGAGLLAVCDIAVVAAGTLIGFPEVRLGLVPGVISPYVIRKIGAGHARHLFLTGERFDGRRAYELGLAHLLVDDESELDDAVRGVLDRLLKVSPEGARRAKQLVHDLDDATEAERLGIARQSIAEARGSDDGKEGTQAFLEKRKPWWIE